MAWKTITIDGKTTRYQANTLTGTIRHAKTGDWLERDVHGNITIHVGDDPCTRPQAVFVLEAMVGPCPDGTNRFTHIDGNPENMRPDNLRWTVPVRTYGPPPSELELKIPSEMDKMLRAIQQRDQTLEKVILWVLDKYLPDELRSRGLNQYLPEYKEARKLKAIPKDWPSWCHGELPEHMLLADGASPPLYIAGVITPIGDAMQIIIDMHTMISEALDEGSLMTEITPEDMARGCREWCIRRAAERGNPKHWANVKLALEKIIEPELELWRASFVPEYPIQGSRSPFA